MSAETRSAQVMTVAREIRRLDAEGGTVETDALAKRIYEAADPCNIWERALQVIERGEAGIEKQCAVMHARRLAEELEAEWAAMFPSADACAAADALLRGAA